MSPSLSPLSELDPNVPQSPEKSKAKGETKSLEYHRQVLESRLKESKNQQSYVSPSDNIMSPATAKLAAFKNRHVKSVKPRALFAKATSNAEAAKQSSSTTLTEREKANDS
ncbi:uncharacterized protein PV09_00496 [Verruconis gallopava]|uniref:Spo12 family protein n=1 Tax=Verruconis gallopava TaxID=253628 RepID=A0A0D2BE15_9PEZI|nr:uncharacterized protein PV09_00496 [Verruconis gallopava]KIW09629.1 hypothetical protein PV09_00496 [Verruconis gallopava]